MTDPRLQDLSELPRRMSPTLDLHALSEDLISRAIEATSAAIGPASIAPKNAPPARSRSSRRYRRSDAHALAEHGIRLAIDDFGTGYSSLARLGEFPAGVLKIDRSFVRGLPDARAARTLVTAIMYLAQGFGLMVVAEGVETEAQRDFLLGAGCPYAQGHLFSRPVEPAEIAGLWSAGTASVRQAPELVAQPVVEARTR